MALKVDQNLCIGCGACVAICPSGFELNSEGKSQVKDPNADCGTKALEACPVQAISI
jgi:ferredoxin